MHHRLPQEPLPTGNVYLGGEWLETDSRLKVESPTNGQIIGEVSLASASHFVTAIDGAQQAFHATRKLSSYQRSAALFKLSELLQQQSERFAQLMTWELGKCIRDSRIEVARAIGVFATAAEESKRIGGEIIDLDWTAGNENRLGLVRRFPIGVIAGITPFNFPLNLVAHKIAPAIASGNCIIIKPASKTPFIALALAELIDRIEYPKGAISIMPAHASQTTPFISDPRVKMISFTGSDTVGWEIRRNAAGKKVALELGGNAAVVVAEDGDLNRAAKRIVSGAFGVAGQSCISVQRIYLQRSIASLMTDLLIHETQQLVVGDPFDDSTDIGTMVDSSAVEKAHALVQSAVAAGGQVICGGITAETNRLTFVPTLLSNVPDSHPLCLQEAFAPIAIIERYDSLSEVIDKINKSPFGLQAGIFTRRLSDALRCWRDIECGGIIVNDIPTWRVDQMPYGGMKRSGIGREGIRYAIEEMTEPKLLAIRPEEEH